MELKPVFDNILIERIVEEKGIIIPDTPEFRIGPKQAKVIAVGPGRPSEYSANMLPPPPCQPGDVVVFHGGAGVCVRVGSKDYWMIKPGDLIGIVTP